MAEVSPDVQCVQYHTLRTLSPLELEKNANNMFGHEDQGNISSSPHIGPEPASVTTATIMRSGHLPMPQLGIIGEIEKAIKALARTQAVKERICEYIQQEVSVIPVFFADPAFACTSDYLAEVLLELISVLRTISSP
jgi:hypothetical protein